MYNFMAIKFSLKKVTMYTISEHGFRASGIAGRVTRLGEVSPLGQMCYISTTQKFGLSFITETVMK
jgi:hypothetical protein